jgi:hypothetical protein
MKKFTVRLFVALTVATLGLVSASRALAVTVPINFTGTEQNFDATIDLTGNLFADGSGSVVNTKNKVEPFKFTPPLEHPLSLYGGAIVVGSDPITDPAGTTFDLPAADQIANIAALNLDLLNGTTADFALDTVTITTNSTVTLLKAITIDLSGTLADLRFTQTGAAILNGTGGSGTFSVDGELSASIDNLLAVVFGILQVPVDPQSISAPFTLTGTWTSTGPSNNVKVALDANIDFSIPLSLLTNLTTSITDVLSLTISSTIDLAASLTVGTTLHLEQSGIVIPEPGSMVLLGLGLLAFAPLAARRIRR